MQQQPKDPNTVFLIEFVGGFFGILGLGYFYVGRTEDGLIRLIAWLVYYTISYTIIVILSMMIIGCFLIPFQLAIQIGVSFWSATTLKNDMLNGRI